MHYFQLPGDLVTVQGRPVHELAESGLAEPSVLPAEGEGHRGETNKGSGASPVPTRRALARATRRRCGSPARTPRRPRGPRAHGQGKRRGAAAGRPPPLPLPHPGPRFRSLAGICFPPACKDRAAARSSVWAEEARTPAITHSQR